MKDGKPETLEEAMDLIAKQNEAQVELDKTNKELLSLKGRQGRELGEVKKRLSEYTKKKKEENTVDLDNLSEEDINEALVAFNKNPIKYLNNITQQIVKAVKDEFIPVIKESNTKLDRYGLLLDYPEFKDKKVQDDIINYVTEHKEKTGEELTDRQALERIKVDQKAGELKAKEEAIKVKEAELNKAGGFTGGGSIIGGEPVSGDGKPDPGTAKWNQIVAAGKSEDKAPF